jgi:hypothetical protein
VSDAHAASIAALSEGTLPDEWPLNYWYPAGRDGAPAINDAVQRYFGDRSMSTRPHAHVAPRASSASPASSPLASASRSVRPGAAEDVCASRDAAGDADDPADRVKLLVHQAVVYALAQGLARPAPPGAQRPRGLLVWHSTGAGKTAVAAGIMDAFHARSPGRRIIYLTSKNALDANPPEAFAKEARRFYARWREEPLSRHEVAVRYRAGMDTAPRRAGAPMLLMNFAEFSHKLGLFYQGKENRGIARADAGFAHDAVLIIDEVHNLFRPLPGQEGENGAVRRWLMRLPGSGVRRRDYAREQGDMKVFVMTATPGDTPRQLTRLLGIVYEPRREAPGPLRPPHLDSAEDVERFVLQVSGLVSYVDLSRDPSRFPQLAHEVVECRMSAAHARSYGAKFRRLVADLRALNVAIAAFRAADRGSHARWWHDPIPGIDAFVRSMVVRGLIALPTGAGAGAAGAAGARGESDLGADADAGADEGDGSWHDVPAALRPAYKRALAGLRAARRANNWGVSREVAVRGGMGTGTGTGSVRGGGTGEQSKTLHALRALTRMEALEAHSPKTARLIGQLASRQSAKHYVYSEFKETCMAAHRYNVGIQSIGVAMEMHGYVRLFADDVHWVLERLSETAGAAHDDARARAILEERLAELKRRDASLPAHQRAFLEPGTAVRDAKCYVLLVSSELDTRRRCWGSDGGTATATATAKAAAGPLREVPAMFAKLYNCWANRHGRLVHAMLASERYNEGMDLEAVQHVHLIEAPRSTSALEQTVGRARRNCSHRHLDRARGEWVVHVHQYMTALPEGITSASLAAGAGAASSPSSDGGGGLLLPRNSSTVDAAVLKGATEAGLVTERFFRLVKQRAVDCRLLERFHKAGDPAFRCRVPVALPPRVATPTSAVLERPRSASRSASGPRTPAPPGAQEMRRSQSFSSSSLQRHSHSARSASISRSSRSSRSISQRRTNPRMDDLPGTVEHRRRSGFERARDDEYDEDNEDNEDNENDYSVRRSGSSRTHERAPRTRDTFRRMR